MWKRCLSWALGLGLVACGPEASWEQAPREEWAVLEQRAMQTVEPLLSARYQHCSMVLPDGKVLFVGGMQADNTKSSTTELYDPLTRRTSWRAPMNAVRRSHTCLSLRDGTLLVMGGSDDSSNDFAERYDAASNTWTRLPKQPTSLWAYGMSMVQLDDGRVLVTGGLYQEAGSYLFDPTANTWSVTGSLNRGRTEPALVKLRDGRVLAIGGQSTGAGSSASLEVYTPSSGTWSALASPQIQTAGLKAALLPDGRVFVLSDASTLDYQAQLYDVATNSWSRLPKVQRFQAYGSRLVLVGGQPIVVSGIYNYDVPQPVLRFDVAQWRWTTVGQLSKLRSAFSLDVLPDGSVLAAGGVDWRSKAAYETMDLYVPDPTSPAEVPPLVYTATATNSARQNTVHRSLTLNEGDTLEVGTCNVPGSSAWGDTYLRLFGDDVQVAVNDDSCGSASFIRYTALTTGTYELRAGCSANGECGGTVSFRVIPSPSTPMSYTAANTNSAQQNTVNRSLTLHVGDTLEVGTCGLSGSSAWGDTYLRLFGAGGQVAFNDDSCGSASFIRYTAPTTGTYELRAGCYAGDNCGGIVVFRIIPAPTSPFRYTATATNSAQRNTVNRSFMLNAGDLLEVGTCGLPGASVMGDTYLRVFGAGVQVAFSDDACFGTASYLLYTAPTAGLYEVRAGCYGGASCGGTVVFRITPAEP